MRLIIFNRIPSNLAPKAMNLYVDLRAFECDQISCHCRGTQQHSVTVEFVNTAGAEKAAILYHGAAADWSKTPLIVQHDISVRVSVEARVAKVR